MRAIALLLCLAGIAAAEPATAPAGFDHNAHFTKVDVAGLDLACTACHAVRGGLLLGRPDHGSCFGKCHGARPAAKESPPPERMIVCTACHAESTIASAAPKKVLYPPYKLDPDFALQIGHKTHAAVACGSCHGATRAAPHKRCAGCHDTKAFAMTECVRCHERASGHPEPPGLARTAKTQIFVTGAFSHARHAARSAAGKTCTTCHAALLATDDRQMPRPSVDSCAVAGCHDGKAAFPATASCTRCHKDVPSSKFDVARPPDRFSHVRAEHVTLPCAGCHPLGKTGEPIVAGHAPCVSCHTSSPKAPGPAGDFGLRWPQICGACHNGTEPWRKLVPDRLPPETTEFGVSLDHRKHPAPCATCHSLTTAGTELRPPRGHRACSGAACHAVTTGPAPHLTACEDCHVRGILERRAQTRFAVPWSVRATFRHAPHARTVGGEVACTACHDDLSAPTMLSLAAPKKAACAPCHDGRASFKLTGTTCTRCHPGGPK